MVIRLAAVEGDKFSGNSDSGVQHYEANQGPTDLSTANIQYVTDIIRIYNKGCTTQLLLLGKFEYTGGPIFKVVLEC